MVEEDKEKQNQAMALMDEKEEAKAATKEPKATTKKKKAEGEEEATAPEAGTTLFDAAPAAESEAKSEEATEE